jgi:hypothetical protein
MKLSLSVSMSMFNSGMIEVSRRQAKQESVMLIIRPTSRSTATGIRVHYRFQYKNGKLFDFIFFTFFPARPPRADDPRDFFIVSSRYLYAITARDLRRRNPFS